MIWYGLKKASPLPGRSYLVASESIGTVYDVAFFNGKSASGGLWWTLTDIDFPANLITHWCYIENPHGADKP